MQQNADYPNYYIINRITANQGMRTLSPLAESAHAVVVPVHSSLFQAVVVVTCQCLVLGSV
jgi:hypothetical protein